MRLQLHTSSNQITHSRITIIYIYAIEASTLLDMFNKELLFFQLRTMVIWFKVLDIRLLFFGMIYNSIRPSVKIQNKMVLLCCIKEIWWILMKKFFDCLRDRLVFHYAFPVVSCVFSSIVGVDKLLCTKHKLAKEECISAN